MQNTIATGLAITWVEGPSDMYPTGHNGEQECYTAGGMQELVLNLKAKPQVTLIDCFAAGERVTRAERDSMGDWVVTKV